jgi:hypothetical protein
MSRVSPIPGKWLTRVHCAAAAAAAAAAAVQIGAKLIATGFKVTAQNGLFRPNFVTASWLPTNVSPQAGRQILSATPRHGATAHNVSLPQIAHSERARSQPAFCSLPSAA